MEVERNPLRAAAKIKDKNVNDYIDEGMKMALKMHDQYYFAIQKYTAPIIQNIPRDYFGYAVFTANGVTYGRTLLVLLICFLIRFNYNGFGAFLILFHDFLDHVDGVVAKVQREDGRGEKDDAVYGAFIDAFCDKIVFGVTLWTILILMQYEEMSYFLILLIAVPAFVLVMLEVIIGAVRVNDYFHTKYSDANDKPRALRAVMEGKLKQKLESVGIALLAWILPVPGNHYILCLPTIFCLLGAIYMAKQSLVHKLAANPAFAKYVHADAKAPQ